MIVEIRDANFINKGAELMLRTILKELSKRIPEFQAAVFPIDDRADARASLGIKHILPSLGRGRLSFTVLGKGERVAAALGGENYRKLLRHYGLVNVRMPDALVDMSGYAFADTSRRRVSKDFLCLTSTYKRRGAPVILLPQAFGPFTRGFLRRRFRRITENVDLMFARDAESYLHVREVAPEFPHVYVAPDITLYDGYDGRDPGFAGEPYCCFIPNHAVLSRTGDRWAGKYEGCMRAAVSTTLDQGLCAKILVYSTEAADALLASRLAADFDSARVEVIAEEDPYELKRILANSQLAVSSRYHGLVSAFSQGTPAIALGWAHKYSALFADFEMAAYSLDHRTSPEEVAEKSRLLLDSERNAEIRQILRRRLQEMAELNSQMWEQVSTLLVSRTVGR